MKVLDNGIAVIEGDTHLSVWVEQCGRLDHDKDAIPKIQRLLRLGDNVLDVGSNIGTHAYAYAHAIGPKGRVWAFEPNPTAHECLAYNMAKFCPNVKCVPLGLSDQPGFCRIEHNPNAGASMLHPLAAGESGAEATVVTLDDFFLHGDGVKINFCKLDCEGMEPRVLRGAAKLIARDRPILYCEVNPGALIRQGSSERELLDLIANFGYRLEPTGSGAQYDVFCFPLPDALCPVK